MKASFNTILFDLDGTLADTSAGILESLRYTIEKLGLPNIMEEEMLSFIGPPLSESFKKYYEMEENDVLTAISVFRDYYGSKGLYNVALYDGVEQMLKNFKKESYILGVATYKKEDLAIKVLKHLGIIKYFDIVHGADSEGNLKKFEIIQRCIGELNANLDNCVYVGDTEGDAMAASLIGMSFVGVTWGFGYKKLHVSDGDIQLIDSPLGIISKVQA